MFQFTANIGEYNYYHVDSRSSAIRRYLVKINSEGKGTCTCGAFVYNIEKYPDYICKHIKEIQENLNTTQTEKQSTG